MFSCSKRSRRISLGCFWSLIQQTTRAVMYWYSKEMFSRMNQAHWYLSRMRFNRMPSRDSQSCLLPTPDPAGSLARKPTTMCFSKAIFSVEKLSKRKFISLFHWFWTERNVCLYCESRLYWLADITGWFKLNGFYWYRMFLDKYSREKLQLKYEYRQL